MDIERAIEFILDQQAKAAEAHRKLEEQLGRWDERQARWDERQARWDERQARGDERQARWEEQQALSAETHDREVAQIRGILRRAIVAGVREARAARKRHEELDLKITQLAAAQLITEEELQKLIASQRRSTNGGSPQQ
jgi:hypothetical protein